MSILKYQIEDGSFNLVSAWIDKQSDIVCIQTEGNIVEVSFADWKKLRANIDNDIAELEESKPKNLFFGYQIVKK
jgi:hypothetical protein